MKLVTAPLILAALIGAGSAAGAATIDLPPATASVQAQRHAFDDVKPLTIEQENAAKELALDMQGAPLHTP
jgi:hypothetical protein